MPSSGYEVPSDGFGAPAYNPQHNYGAPQFTSSGSHSGLHGPHSQHNGDHAAHAVDHSQHSGGDAQPSINLNVPNHEPNGQIVTNIHHHFYHDGQESSNAGYTRDRNHLYDDSEVFKREVVGGIVPNSAGALPANMPSGAVTIVKAPSSVSVQGFKFPKSRKVDGGAVRRGDQREPHSIEIQDDELPAKKHNKVKLQELGDGAVLAYQMCQVSLRNNFFPLTAC